VIQAWWTQAASAYPSLKDPHVSIEIERKLFWVSFLDWQLFSLIVWIICLHAFLSFRVYAERSEVILKCLFLYVSLSFFSYSSQNPFFVFMFNLFILILMWSIVVLFWSCLFEVLIMKWCIVVLFWSCVFEVHNASYTWVCVSLYLFGKFSFFISFIKMYLLYSRDIWEILFPKWFYWIGFLLILLVFKFFSSLSHHPINS
jgi:hypothetical protein